MFEEIANGATITLVKEGLFWRAYEQNAYLFAKLFWPDLKVNSNFMKSLGKELFYVGFPDTSLQSKVIDKIPEVLGSRLLTQSNNMIVIAGVPLIEGFEAWKQSYKLLHAQANEQMQPFYGKLPLYKAVYDFFQEMVNLTRHFPKDLHYTLGDKIVDHVLEMNTCLYRALHLPKGADGYTEAKSRTIERIGELLDAVRFLLRTSFDMRLYNVERFAEVSAKIEGASTQILFAALFERGGVFGSSRLSLSYHYRAAHQEKLLCRFARKERGISCFFHASQCV